jgi:hypothetical protein
MQYSTASALEMLNEAIVMLSTNSWIGTAPSPALLSAESLFCDTALTWNLGGWLRELLISD